ncbi:MAG TPA: SoxR reducing system RseC family protein [Flavobacteriaceae bacterium]|nr:SoxR reducing system RseC family protein [Flavobacteriaceae bacterium]
MHKIDLNTYKKSTVSSNIITHTGKVTNIIGQRVIVALDNNMSCEACKAKAACGVSESNKKEVEVANTNGQFVLNENVTVVMQKQLGMKAVFWAYFFPFTLLITVLFVSASFLPQWQAGLLALLVLIPYYLTLYATKSWFKKAFEVTVLKN